MTSAEKRTILKAAIARAYTAIAETPGAEMMNERFGDLLFNINTLEHLAIKHDGTEDDCNEPNGDVGEPNSFPGHPDAGTTKEALEVPSEAPAPEPSLTKDEVKAKLLALSDQYDDLDVSVVMESMGYSKLSDIPADKYSLLLDKVAEVVKELA